MHFQKKSAKFSRSTSPFRLAFEVLEKRLYLASDFGDAPEPYPTLLVDNAARHEAVGPILGTLRDTETNGQVSLHSDGDGADEDGVSFGTMRAGQLAATMTVNVANAAAGAKLDAWIDFNGDGNWGGGNEKIVTRQSVVNGLNTIEFDIPVDARSGVTYARVRLSSGGGLGFRGAAPDGEVEDYEVTIVSPSKSSGQLGAAQLLSSQEYTNGILTAGDLDQDGDIDIVGISSSQLFWYENRLQDGFLAHDISAGQSFYPLDSDVDITLGDVDSDGDLDVITAMPTFANRSRVITSINEGNQVFHHLELIHLGKLTEALELADLTGDGTLEVYTGLELSPAVPGPILDIKFGDIERDGDLDVIVAFEADDYNQVLALYENDGSDNFNYRKITSNDQEALGLADMNGDGDLEILEASSTWIVVRERASSQEFQGYVMSQVFSESIFTADMDGDGDFDVLPAMRYRNEVLWLENRYAEENNYFEFTEHSVPSVSSAAFTVPADLDGDGDIDVIAAGEEGIFWHENLGSAVSMSVDSPSVAERSGEEVRFAFSRTGDISRALTVDFLVGGTSGFTSDYTTVGATSFSNTRGQVTFAAGESTTDFLVRPRSDLRIENDEVIRIELIDGDDYAFVENPVATLKLIDPADFGDAPDSYATTSLQSGARHNPVGPKLGTQRDQEFDGQPDAAATGDNAHGVADEDGISIGPLQVGAARETIVVTVDSAPQGAKLDAWIDFDGDGTWSGQSEQIADSVAVVNGVNTISFGVPASSKSGTTYARFRISTHGGLGSKDLALDGEVEDYAVQLQPPTTSAAVFSAPQYFDSTSNRTFGYAHEVVDFDRDGDFDIISVDPNTSYFYLRENLRNGRFITRDLGSTGDYVDEMKAADLDGDGDIDLAVAAGNSVSWFENISGQLLIRHQLLDLREQVGGGTGSRSGYEIAIADLDRDGDLDLVSGVNNTAPFGSEQADFYWHKNDGSGTFASIHIDSIAAARNHSVSEIAINVADMDRDGDPDIVTFADQDLVWYENASLQFSERRVSYLSGGLSDRFDDAIVGDFDRDGDSDVVSIEKFGSRMSLHVNSEAQFYRSTIFTVDSFEFSRASAGDMDGDGDLDVLVSGRISSDSLVYVLLNDGNGAFTPRVISDLLNRYADPTPIDVDNDGDLDISFTGIEWLENINSTPSADFDGDGKVSGRDFLIWQRGHGSQNAFFGQGDANNDRAVNGTDLAIWSANYGTGIEPLPGDFNQDAYVNGRDFLVWQRGGSPNSLSGDDLSQWQQEYGDSELGSDLSENNEGVPVISDQLNTSHMQFVESSGSVGDTDLAIAIHGIKLISGSGVNREKSLHGESEQENVVVEYAESYVEEVDRAIEHFIAIPSSLRSFGEMVTRRSVKRLGLSTR